MATDENLIRFGVSLSEQLSHSFDLHIKRKHYPNRSEAIRDLIRRTLIEEEIDENQTVIGVLHLLYDHHKGDLADRLAHLQHGYHELIISTTHVHLDHDNCLEVVLMRGRSGLIRDISDQMIAAKGVKHGQLYLTSQGENIR